MNKEVVVSGIRPTGFLHLGNYFGAMRNFVKMQKAYNCYFFVADWHSLTTHPDTATLQQSVHRVLAEYIASGLDPDIATLYVQSDVPEITELYLYLNMLAYKGELEKVPTFKDKVRLSPQNINAGLLTYPVLMAADILIQRAVKVPVGKDQEQHLEMSRHFAERFNHRYGEVFPMPKAFNFSADLVKILSLDGEGKMSKSENQLATVFLSDDDDLIRKKIMKARTDSGPTEPDSEMPDYIGNLFYLLSLVSRKDIYDKFHKDFKECNVRYGDLKKQLSEDLVAFVKPIREKAQEIRNDKKYLHEVMKQGAEKARANASATLTKIREAMQLVY